MTELANSTVGVTDNLDEVDNFTNKPNKADNTDGDTVEVGAVVENAGEVDNANDNAGEMDYAGDTIVNDATECCIRSQLISRARLFSTKEEIDTLLMSGSRNTLSYNLNHDRAENRVDCRRHKAMRST
ncbi:hypothetical protein G6F49_011692 [Rhizopus delemar]|nr:hypothetical protein G6F49_011692 [Rhizopus delemar]KAG1578785.1 hypothetical protein G6F48_011662 [Rhizopus delemar]KAG1629511.1 hypothetical protein G6F44_011604 [Rhizopus delemar]